jgi:heme exporter protein B
LIGSTTVGSIIRKDLLIECRSRHAFLTILFFGVLILAVGNFALGGSAQQTTTYGPGVLWITFLFAGLLFLNHVVQIEKEESTLTALLISPATPGQIFTGKLISAVAFLFVLQMILLPVFHVLFNYKFTLNYFWLILVILLASIGYCALGILFSTMSLSLKNREMILSIMLFPILIPLLIISTKASVILLNELKAEHFFSWLKMLAAFDVIFVVLSYWSYFWIVEDV